MEKLVVERQALVCPPHPWLRRIRLAYVPGETTPLLEAVSADLLRCFQQHGHQVQAAPNDETDAILTTALFNKPLNWREALLFTARRRFRLLRSPTLFTLVHAAPTEFRRLLGRLAAALDKDPPDPADYAFPGLSEQAYRVLVEQGRRGGPILALERLLQAQVKSIRIILVIGDERPLEAYHFDLAGAHPRSDGRDLELFYEDVVLRTVTAVSAREVTDHQVAGDPIPLAVWQSLTTPAAMRTAGQYLGERNFFTDMVRIADLVAVPAMMDAVADQYSEGCFATWEPALGALVSTITGSARPVDKGGITDDDLAVIVGVRPDGRGALVRHVVGKRNDPPSTEAVEMKDMDSLLPTIFLDWVAGGGPLPVVRSKLHGHRGVAAYDSRYVEYVPLELAYYHYPVSCGTDAQARAICGAFARAQALQNPADPCQVVFTVLPGHGVVIVEKWVRGKAPFQVIWESMDSGYLEIDAHVPQGPMEYVPAADGRMVLYEAG